MLVGHHVVECSGRVTEEVTHRRPDEVRTEPSRGLIGAHRPSNTGVGVQTSRFGVTTCGRGVGEHQRGNGGRRVVVRHAARLRRQRVSVAKAACEEAGERELRQFDGTCGRGRRLGPAIPRVDGFPRPTQHEQRVGHRRPQRRADAVAQSCGQQRAGGVDRLLRVTVPEQEVHSLRGERDVPRIVVAHQRQRTVEERQADGWRAPDDERLQQRDVAGLQLRAQQMRRGRRPIAGVEQQHRRAVGG